MPIAIAQPWPMRFVVNCLSRLCLWRPPPRQRVALMLWSPTALLVKVDLRQQRAAQEARQALESFGLPVLGAEVPLLAAFDKAEAQGVTVDRATDDRGRADPRRMAGWSAYCTVAQEIECLISKPSSVASRIISPLPLSA